MNFFKKKLSPESYVFGCVEVLKKLGNALSEGEDREVKNGEYNGLFAEEFKIYNIAEKEKIGIIGSLEKGHSLNKESCNLILENLIQDEEIANVLIQSKRKNFEDAIGDCKNLGYSNSFSSYKNIVLDAITDSVSLKFKTDSGPFGYDPSRFIYRLVVNTPEISSIVLKEEISRDDSDLNTLKRKVKTKLDEILKDDLNEFYKNTDFSENKRNEINGIVTDGVRKNVQCLKNCLNTIRMSK
ncbi:hypothetical protein KAT80_01445 [Candidatus Pacearchaeota archaeon]|nr:hypothetical protein [Candidatus Pacearchaeota archaeon]